MSDTILTAERRQDIADMINKIIVASIMTDTFSREASELGAKARLACNEADADALYRQSREKHERWGRWWNSGHEAAEKLRGMGIPVITYAKPAKL
jgi:hypothetical protein